MTTSTSPQPYTEAWWGKLADRATDDMIQACRVLVSVTDARIGGSLGDSLRADAIVWVERASRLQDFCVSRWVVATKREREQERRREEAAAVSAALAILFPPASPA